MGKRTGVGGGQTNKSKGPPRWWCYYCDTRHEGELQLIQHQRHKHFLCRLCDPKSYGRNCLSLSGLVSHVRRSHRTEMTEVPGAIEGRKNLDVEVSAMNGIPQGALDDFENKLAEEMLHDYPGRAPEPQYQDSDDDYEEEPPPLPQEPEFGGGGGGGGGGKHDDSATVRPLGIPDLAWVANQLASQDGQYVSLLAEHAAGTGKNKPNFNNSIDVKAFDPSMLAARLAGTKAPADIEAQREEMERKEEMERAKKEEKARREEEKRVREEGRKSVSIAFLMKKEIRPIPVPQVPQVDKSVVADVGFALQARAQEARAAGMAERKAKTTTESESVTLGDKLTSMQPGALLKFAADVGVNKDDILKAKGAKDFLVQLILQMETEESWSTITFTPGKVGIKADWARGEVESVTEGEQGALRGVQVGWMFKTISGEKFSKFALQNKVTGSSEYKVVFATADIARDRSRQIGGGRYDPGAVRRKRLREPEEVPELEPKRARGEEGEEPIAPEDEDKALEDAERALEEELRGQQGGGQEHGDRRDSGMDRREPPASGGGRRFQERQERAPREEELEPEENGRRGGHGRRFAERGRRRDEEYDVEDDGRGRRGSRRFQERGDDDYEEEDEEPRRRDGRGHRGHRYEEEYDVEDDVEDEYEGRRSHRERRHDRRDDYEDEDEGRGHRGDGHRDERRGDDGRKRGVARLLPR